MGNRGEILAAKVIPSRERRRLQVRDGAEKVNSASGRVTAPRLIATSGRVSGRVGGRLILVRARRTREVQVIVKPVAISVDRRVTCLSLRIALYGLVERGLGMIVGDDSPFPHGPDSPQDQPVMDRPVGEPVADQVGTRQGP